MCFCSKNIHDLALNLMSSYEVRFFNSTTDIHSKIDFDKPKITLILGDNNFEVNLDKSVKPKVEDIQDFAFLLRNHILLIHLFNGAITPESLVADLSKEI